MSFFITTNLFPLSLSVFFFLLPSTPLSLLKAHKKERKKITVCKMNRRYWRKLTWSLVYCLSNINIHTHNEILKEVNKVQKLMMMLTHLSVDVKGIEKVLQNNNKIFYNPRRQPTSSRRNVYRAARRWW